MARKRPVSRWLPGRSRYWGLALLLSIGALIVLALAASQQGSFLDFRNRAAGSCVTVSEGDCSPGCRWVPITKTVDCNSFSYRDCPAGCRKVSSEGPPVCKTVQKQTWVNCSVSKHAGSDCDYNPATRKWTGGYYETSSVQECTQRPSTGNNGYCSGGVKTTQTGRCVPAVTTPTPYPPGTQPAAKNFDELCQRDPNATTIIGGTCTHDSSLPCAEGTATNYKVDCKGNRTPVTARCAVQDPTACATAHQEHKTEDTCNSAKGCWVKASKTCVENGQKDSGWTCKEGFFRRDGAPIPTYPAKNSRECDYQGGCWFDSKCLRPGASQRETGGAPQNQRTFCCAGPNTEGNTHGYNILKNITNGGSCQAKVTTTIEPTPIPTSPGRLCSFAMAWDCGTKKQTCFVVDDQEQCVSTSNTSGDTSPSDVPGKSCSSIQWFMCNYNADCGCQTPQ